MLTNQEVVSLRELVFGEETASRTIAVLKATWKKLTNLDASWPESHRDVDWGNAHTQHDRYDAYDRW
jgi:hypothetical protein